MKSLLLVIDVQNDFINNNTEDYVSKIDDLINSNKYDLVVFTKFINDENSNFYKELNYKGCMNNEGREIVLDTKNYRVFEKRYYTAFNTDLKEYILVNNVNTVYLCGFDTDACILKTALDLFEHNINVFVLEEYCMSHSGYYFHNAAILMLKKMIGTKNII